jgi:1-deoxy-D-xylulose-5-phosphate synthase
MVPVRRVGLPDKFVEQGPQKLLRSNCGLDAAGIAKEARDLCR